MAQTNVQAFSGDVEISSNLAVDTNTLFVDSVGNKVGIGGGANAPTSPANTMHVYKEAAEATSGLLIEKASGGAGTSAALFFGVNAPTENANVAKGAIFYERNLVNGRGDIKFCNDSVDDANPVTTAAADTRMIITNGGNVGIATVSPQSRLHIYPSNTAGAEIQMINFAPSFAEGYLGITATSTHANAVGADLRFKGRIYVSSSVGANYEVMCLKPNGKVGVGTANPYAKFHVHGTGNINTATGARSLFYWGTNYMRDTGSFNDVSIYSTGPISTNSWIVSLQGAVGGSDERIKKEIVDVEDGSALETLRLLKPKQYKYVDEVQRGSEPVWGFIAQEVGATLPYATQLRTECLPNIYELANVSDSNVITFTNFDTSNLESNAMVLKVFDKDDTEHLINITEVLDEHSVRVDEDLSELTGSVDESGNVVAGNQLFMYGQQVDDFVFLKKDAIWTVATSALQEVDRQLQAEKVKVITLETQLTSVLTRLDALEGA